MDGISYLAKLFIERNNIKKIGVVIGKIIDVVEEKQYVKVSILNSAIQKDKFYSLIQRFEKEDIGKEIVAIMTEDNQQLIVLGYCKQFLP